VICCPIATGAFINLLLNIDFTYVFQDFCFYGKVTRMLLHTLKVKVVFLMRVSNIYPCYNTDCILYPVTADACSNAVLSNPVAADGHSYITFLPPHAPHITVRYLYSKLKRFQLHTFCIFYSRVHVVMSCIYIDRGTS
jgi:hypothetical protein